MSGDIITTEHAILTELLEQGKYRKTPERYAVFDIVCRMKKPFSIDDLEDTLDDANAMRLCRTTLYNTLNLLVKLKLVVRQKLNGKTVYLRVKSGSGSFWMVCTECGKVNEVSLPKVGKMLNEVKVKGFKKDGFELFFYGICRHCSHTNAKEKDKMKKEKPAKGVGKV